MSDPAGDGPTPPAPDRLVRLVVARGAASGLMVAVPAAMANVILVAQDPKPVAAINATLPVLLLGFAIAGFVGAFEAPGRQVAHGVAAALVAFVPVEVIGILGRLDRGDPVSVPAIVFVVLLAAGAGWVGARIGAARRARRDPS